MRPIYCGNLERDISESDLQRLFSRYGEVVKVKMKSGFAFIFMEEERDAEDAIRGLDRSEFGRRGRRLQVEWTKQEHGSRSSGNMRPTKTLFVVNFDPVNTKKRDLERHFGPYGKILDIRMRSDFAFIQFESQADATEALEATNMSKLMDCVITVEYAGCDDEGRRNGYSPDRRSRDRSPNRRSDFGRSARSSRRSSANLRPTKTLFVANIDPVYTRMWDLEEHFEPYGRILEVRIRKNFAFVQFEFQEDATKALKATNMSKLRDRVISVEYAVSDDDGRRNGYSPDKRGRDRSSDRRNRECGRSASSSRTYANLRPAKTLFIVNFDPVNTRKLDLEMHFEPYGKILDVRIRKTFAFIQFESQEDATKALEATHMSKLLDHVISVEYAACDDDRNGSSPDRRGRDQSRDSRSRDCELSVSPRRGIKRPSPDYSRDPSPYRKRELSGSHSSGRAASPVY